MDIQLAANALRITTQTVAQREKIEIRIYDKSLHHENMSV